MTDNEDKKAKKKKKNETEKVEMPVTGRRFFRRTGDIREPEESTSIWLISFTDVMALMLTFFVLLFSMTEPAQKDWSEITAALNSEFNKFYGAAYNRGPQEALNLNRINFNQALNISYLNVLLQNVMEDSEILKQVKLIPQPGHLVISLPRDLLFDAGSATVRDEGRRALYALGGSLARIKNRIEVTGHADPRVNAGGEGGFESNWELSLARAMNVAAILESVGYERSIAARGYSSGRYEDLSSMGDEQARLDLARRVDIIVLDHDGAKQKVFFDPGNE